MQDEKIFELKAALDASYLSKQKDYEISGITKEDFYESALKRIGSLVKDAYKPLEQIEENLSFITRSYRSSIAKNVFYDKGYIDDMHEYAMRGDARYLGYIFSDEEKYSKILQKFKEIEKEVKKRSFSKEADYLDSFLWSVKPKQRVELLNRIINNDKSFNIHFSSKKFNELYDIDLDKLKLLLLDNAYRVSVVASERSGLDVINMLSDKEGQIAIREYQTNRDILIDYMKEVHNVAEYVSRLNHSDLEMLINIYTLSLNSRRGNDLIRYADTINSGYGDRIEVFRQFESLDTIDEIKRLQNQGYQY